MDRSAAKVMPTDEIIFHDGLGDRVLVRDTNGRPLHETLVLRTELTSVPSFEFTLNQRLTQLDRFEHSAFVAVRQLIRLPGPVPSVSLVSDYVPGMRLSDALANYEQTGKALSTGTALFFVREILDAVSVLHRQSAEVAHGALAPERILIADGKIRVTDYALGSAIEQLRYSPERYWKDLRVTLPPAAGGLRFDRRVDVAQVGMIAVALLASRPLRDGEHIGGLGDVLADLTQFIDSKHKSLALPLRGWLMKALHMDLRRTFVTAVEAEHALEEAMSESGVRPTPSEADIAFMTPRRAGPAIVMKQQVPPSVTVPVAPPRAPVQQTMALPAKAPRKDAWDAPDADTRSQTLYNGTVAQPSRPSRGGGRTKGLFKLGVLGVCMAAAFTAAQYIPPPAKLFSTTGTLVVETKPDGVELLIDKQSRGVTPLTLKLKAGSHEVELRGMGKPRVFNVFVTKGDRVSQYIEFPARIIRK
jgi:hypothetical protein